MPHIEQLPDPIYLIVETPAQDQKGLYIGPQFLFASLVLIKGYANFARDTPMSLVVSTTRHF